jgi:hypothetical protein
MTKSRMSAKLDRIACDLNLLRHLLKLNTTCEIRQQYGFSNKEIKQMIYSLQVYQTELRKGKAKLYSTRERLTKYSEAYGAAYRNTPFYYVVKDDRICGNKFYLWKENAQTEVAAINKGKPCIGPEVPRNKDLTVDETRLKLPTSHMPKRKMKLEMLPDDDITKAFMGEWERELKKTKKGR